MAGEKVLIVHRYSGNPKSDWYPWLKRMLEARDFKVEIARLPSPDKHTMDECVNSLEVSVLDVENTFFVGHGIGCQAIMRYLERETLGSAKGMLLVAPFLHLRESALNTPQGKRVSAEWLSKPINLDAVKSNAGTVRILAAKEDPYIPEGDAKELASKLGATVTTMPIRTHFTAEDGYAELHAALNEFMKL